MDTSALNIEKILRTIRVRLSNQVTLLNQLKLLGIHIHHNVLLYLVIVLFVIYL